MAAIDDERTKQKAVGIGILLLLMVLVPGLLMTWRKVPGLVGEALGTVMGIATTPFFMEASFVILGVVIVITLNHFRRVKDGDDFVSVDLPEEDFKKGESEV